ncbi:MAG: DUF6526 family protein [Candidatus Hydrogenedentes bacterium]|nr:DUF6526 family protein [Candidatus Hydrogenedentota bacterium]
MPAQQPQSYANHVVVPKLLRVQILVLLVVCALAVIAWNRGDTSTAATLLAVAVLVQALVGVSMVIKSRLYAVTLQDRIVRLEMQVRLERVLPDDWKPRIKELTLPQLIGLRFASDDEMPALVQKVLDEGIDKSDPIKRLVKNWQADHQRV